jgi:hypothetical protein
MALEPRQNKNNVPAWWPKRLDFADQRQFTKHGKPSNPTLCLVAYNEQSFSMSLLASYLTMRTRYPVRSRIRSLGLLGLQRYGRRTKATVSQRIHCNLGIHQSHQAYKASITVVTSMREIHLRINCLRPR